MMRILLVDDHVLVRAGIRALLEMLEGVAIVAEASDGLEALALVRLHRPDLVVMDISMRGSNGIDATEAILSDFPDTKVLILSMHAAEEFVRRAIKAGACGYVVKDSVPIELRLAVEAIARGELYLSPRLSRSLVSALVRGDSALESLTLRQREVLQLIAEGKSTRTIAALLKLSVKTIETHRAGLMERLGIHDVAGLVTFAARHQLIAIDPLA
ncbi:MAG TPA: response regulator transcription factor [Usitatibacter sp.]|jgi:DNA-binding NarL/FixJ family response regulator|nr:response regulator transcription factor [Usitatibacter sp.]